MFVTKLALSEFKVLNELKEYYGKDWKEFKFKSFAGGWNTSTRKIIFAFQLFLWCLHYYRYRDRIIFGSRLCKIALNLSILFPRGRTIYIFNEINDKFLDLSPRQKRQLSKGILVVSSPERALYVSDKLKLSKQPNVMFNYPEVRKTVNNNMSLKRRGLIYIGQLKGARFSDEVYDKLCTYSVSTSEPVDFICHDVLEKRHIHNHITVLPKLPQSEMIEVLLPYKYGLLSYEPSNVNNDLCAPIKIYEYLEAGLIPVSVFKNQAFTELNKKYPNLVLFLNEIHTFEQVRKIHQRSVVSYLQDVEVANNKFKALILEQKRCQDS